MQIFNTDTNASISFPDIYNQDMKQSSVYTGCIFSRMNETAMNLMGSEMGADGRTSRVSGVSWWKVGSEVYAMSEAKDGHKVDPHNLVALSRSDYGPGIETAPSFPECHKDCHTWSSLNPAHETYDDNLGLISTIGEYYLNETTGELLVSRIVYHVEHDDENGENSRKVLGNWYITE